jgi:hypothetical protein
VFEDCFDVEVEVMGLPGPTGPVDLVQETGQSQTAVMSQKATTDALGGKLDRVETVGGDRLYGVTSAGAQNLYPAKAGTTPNSIAMRDSGGRLTANAGTTSANYVATVGQLSAKLDAARVAQTVDPQATSDVPSSAAVDAFVRAMIATLEGIGLEQVHVEELPEVGETGKLYFVGPDGGPMTEWVWFPADGRFEEIGPALDLSLFVPRVVETDARRMEVEPSADELAVRLQTKDPDSGQWVDGGRVAVGPGNVEWTASGAGLMAIITASLDGGLSMVLVAETEDGASDRTELAVGPAGDGFAYRRTVSDGDSTGFDDHITSGRDGLVHELVKWDPDGEKTVRWWVDTEGLQGRWIRADGTDHSLEMDAPNGRLLLDGQPLMPAVQGPMPAEPRPGVIYLVTE